MFDPMLMLVAAATVWLALHLLVSGTAIRGGIVAIIGEGPFQGVFSLASVASLLWLIWSYGAAFSSDNFTYWEAPKGLMHAGTLVMLLAFLLAVPGLLTPGPTLVGMGDQVTKGVEPTGIHRITRHPFLWGVLLWAAIHTAMNGDRASLVLFVTFLLLTIFGTRSIDAKRAKSYGEHWARYARLSSNIPFAAILAGRNKLVLSEIGLLRFVAALIAFGAVLYAHKWLFSVSPISGWTPY